MLRVISNKFYAQDAINLDETMDNDWPEERIPTAIGMPSPFPFDPSDTATMSTEELTQYAHHLQQTLTIVQRELQTRN